MITKGEQANSSAKVLLNTDTGDTFRPPLLSQKYTQQTMAPVLRERDMFFTYVMALFLLTNAASGATGGAASLTYLILGAIIFFIPSVIATMQLAVLLPYEGGLYNWTYHALGSFWSFFVAIVFWLTGILAAVTSADAFVTVVQGLNPSWLQEPWQQGLVILVLVGVATIIGMQRMRMTQRIINATAICTMVAVVIITLAAVVWLAVLIDIAVLLDALAVMSAFLATSARGWFALSRAGLLPRVLATQAPRYRTPLGGNLLVAIVAAVVIIVTALTQIGVPTDVAQGNLLTQFGVMSTLGSLLIEVIYVILAAVAVRFALEEPGKWWRWIVLLIAVVTPLLGLYGSVVPFPPYPNSIAAYATLIVIVLGAIWAAVLLRTRPVEMQKAKEDDYAWEGDEPEPALY